MNVFLIVVLLALAGCAELSPQSRWQHADQLAGNAGWQKLRIPTDTFILSAYVPKNAIQFDTLTVYIEGDGLAWLNRSQASQDPTPRNPIGLELALRHPEGTAVYLARPCQYAEAGDTNYCAQQYWTGGRFAPVVVESSNQAISVLKQRAGANKLVLVGYSGGGAVAALVAARRNDVVRLVTVAGNLDHRAWTNMHHVPALDASMNPANSWELLADIPQLHFVGERDDVVSLDVMDSYTSRFPPSQRPRVITMPEFNHVCCWIEQWASIWAKNHD